MSAPFPGQDTQGDVFRPQSRAILIPERGVHVPSWYVPHANPTEIVLCERVDGERVTIVPRTCVSDVAPERRWAIREDGTILPQHEFEKWYTRWVEEYVREFGDQPGGEIQWNPQHDPMPNVRHFVSFAVDSSNPRRLKPIHYQNRTQGAKPKELYDLDGENAKPREEVLIRQYQNDKSRLRPDEIREAESALGISSKRPPQLDEMDKLNERLARGDLSREEYAEHCAALWNVPIVSRKRKTKRKGSKSKMQCGEVIYNVQKPRHLQTCPECSGDNGTQLS